MIDYDVPPPPPDEYVYVDRPAFYFGDPDFGFARRHRRLCLPAAAAAGFRCVGATDPGGRIVHPAAAAVRGMLALCGRRCMCGRRRQHIFNNIHNTTVINTVINNPAPSPAAVAAAGGPRNGALVPVYLHMWSSVLADPAGQVAGAAECRIEAGRGACQSRAQCAAAGIAKDERVARSRCEGRAAAAGSTGRGWNEQAHDTRAGPAQSAKRKARTNGTRPAARRSEPDDFAGLQSGKSEGRRLA